ncbi:hypothetical protein GTU73_08790 [Rathayibacter sp. VKM Ac-2804]|uniref:hypothetical protein n=1 Tax=Rathayibacter sp. VKM Ac-2804 TaxID=2609257 RepID=UPI00132EFF52|nr:hypothetical protein [Rathayibacter sp. VKM Ac-2804]QHF24097.1 hypothetical protein GTU73_08790 [Rathayibacter sp. VKM Ac-2804]
MRAPKLTINVGAVTFHGRGADLPEDGGFLIDQSGFTGWDDGVDVRRDETARPEGHGSFDAIGRLGPRTVALAGTAQAPSPEELDALKHRLTGLLADGDDARIQVKRDGETLWGRCRLAARTRFTVRGASGARFADWQLQLWMPDPRKYGATETFEQRPASHRGNFPARPLHRIQGLLPNGYTIFGPTGEYTVIRALDAGHEHTIDMRDGFLRVDGVVDLGGVRRGDVWTVRPGDQVEFTATDLAVLKTEVTDTYI